MVIECFNNEIWFSFGKMPKAPNLGTDAVKAAAKTRIKILTKGG